MKSKQSKGVNKRWKNTFIIAYVVSLMIGGIVIGIDTLNKKEQVAAHPTDTIKLDEGGSNEFTLPVDASQLEEQALRDLSPQFDDYVQGDKAVPVLEKQKIDIFGSEKANNSSPINCSILNVEETQGGNYFILFSISGTSSGGIIRTAVYNKDGEELASNSVGTRHNPVCRVNTKLFNASNNDYLVFTQYEEFFRYTVTESGSTASIQRTQCNVTGRPGTELKADAFQIVNQFGDYSNQVSLTGRIYPYSTGSGRGTYKNRISFGEVDTSGWLSGGFNGGATYQYSVQNLLLHEDLNLTERADASLSMLAYRRNGHTFGRIGYTDIVSAGSSTFQIFSDEDITDTEVSNNGGERPKVVKKRVYHHLSLNEIKANITSGKIINYSVVENLCSDDYVYFFADDGEKCELIRVSLTTYQDEIIKTYPRGISLNFIKNTDGTISYYGSTPELSGDLSSNYYPEQPASGTHYFISGIMNGISESADDLKVKSLRAFELNGTVGAQFAIGLQDNTIFVAGYSLDYSGFPTKKYMIDEASPNYTRNMNQNESPSGLAAFIGKLEIKDDYSPVIKKAPDISVDLDDPAIRTPSTSGYRGWNTLDRWLITGSKNGTVTDVAAIKVYDHFDSNDSSVAGTAAEREEWLQKRINRNPNDANAAIEWNKLGFDKTTAGAQLVTYFVTDTQNQPAVISRWVNKKTGQTEEDGDYCLDAQNFHIPLNGLESTLPDSDTFKKFAKTMAWKTDGTIDEDGTDASKLSAKVTVDTDQLKALREAKSAKPYPVDVIYQPESGVEIKNRVWVFVTTKNTLPNSETNPEITPQDTNGVVYYADDYEMPFRTRGTHTVNDVLTRGNVRVYDYYDSTHETNAELPTLADSNKNANQLIVENLTIINNATEPGKVTPSIRYEWNGAIDANHKDGSIAGNETRGYVDVTLTGNILLHIRQVVIEDSNKLVIPDEGYLKVENWLFNGGVPALNTDYQIQLVVDSGKLTSHPNFTNIGLLVDHFSNNADEVLFKVIIPEFYDYLGYYSTSEQSDPQGASHQGQTNYVSGDLALSKSTLNNQEEIWITFYLKPTQDGQGQTKVPQLYSWDYKKNDLGKIKTK